ncbi:MAG: ABC transporter substrate-binding protein [Candidatus Kariarchaeaceae archaeon]
MVINILTLLKKLPSLFLIVLISFLIIPSPAKGNAQTSISLTVDVPANPVYEQLAYTLKHSWASIGIDLEIATQEWGTYLAGITGRYPSYQLAIIEYQLSPEPDIYSLYHSKGGLNLLGPYNDTLNDQYIEIILGLNDPTERSIVMASWQEQFMQNLPMIPIVSPEHYYAYSSIESFSPNLPFYAPAIEFEAGKTRYYVSMLEDAKMMSPIHALDENSFLVMDLIYDSLIRYDDNNAIVPDLAESYYVEDEGKTWHFSLRDDIYWHDGVRFNASDVYFSAMAAIDEDDLYKSFISGDWASIYDSDIVVPSERWIGNITIDSEFEITFKLGRTYAYIPQTFMMSIIPEHLLNVTDTDLDGSVIDEDAWSGVFDASSVIGTGPYTLKKSDWSRDIQIRLNLRNVSNTHLPGEIALNDPINQPHDISWLDNPSFAIEEVYFRVISQHTTQVTSFETGDLDMVSLLWNFELIESMVDNGFSLVEATHYNIYALLINSNNPVFTEEISLHLKKAMAYQMDKSSMIDTVFYGKAQNCFNPISPINSNYYATLNPYIYEYNTIKAIDEMAAYGIIIDNPNPDTNDTSDTSDTSPSEEAPFFLMQITLSALIILTILRRKRSQ